MRDLFLIACVLGALPFVLWRPYVGILLWCWLSYMNPHRMSWGPAYDMPFAAAIAATTLLGWLLSREPKRVPLCGITVFMMLFAAWISVSTVFALVPEEANQQWSQTVKILLMTYAAIALMQTRDRLHAMVWVIAISLGFFAVKGGLFTVVNGGESRVWGPSGTFFEDNNALALTLLMCIPLMRYLQLHSAVGWVRWGLGAAMALTAFSVIGSYSRGALLGAAAMVVFLILKSRQRVALIVATAALLAVAAAFVPQKWVERMETIETYEEDASAQGRLDAWLYGFRLALQRPLTGGGFNSYADEERFMALVPDAPTNRAYHSIYFQVLGDHGFVGLTLFLAFGLACWFTASGIIRRTRDDPELAWARDLAAMLQVSLVGYGTAGAFQNLAYFDLIYHIAAMIVLTRLLVARSGEAAARRLGEPGAATPPARTARGAGVARPAGPVPMGAARRFRNIKGGPPFAKTDLP